MLGFLEQERHRLGSVFVCGDRVSLQILDCPQTHIYILQSAGVTGVFYHDSLRNLLLLAYFFTFYGAKYRTRVLLQDSALPLSCISSSFRFASFFILICVSVLPIGMFVHPEHAWCRQRPKQGVKSPGTGVTGGCEYICIDALESTTGL